MKRKNTCIFLLFACMQVCFCQAQDSALIDTLIKRIAQAQVKDDRFFMKGIFPSYISKTKHFSTKKADNNIFFNGLIAYTLNDIKLFLHNNHRVLADTVLSNAKPLFQQFKNRKGRNTYNFWRTDSVYDYPYAGFFNFFTKGISLPDDMDDTMLALLALDTDSATASEVHVLMQQYVNNGSNKVRSVIKDYNSLPAYSVWFGKKFPVVFDVSVLCNVLSFVQRYNLVWTKADSAGLSLIIKTIERNYHFTKPVYASPYYPETSLILYHIARLMSIKEIPALEAMKVQLVSDAGRMLAQTGNLVERIILSTAILKWGYEPPAVDLPSINDIEEMIGQNDFCFFTGNIPSYFKDFYKNIATKKNIGFFYHYCPAYNDALLLEYLVLKNSDGGG